MLDTYFTCCSSFIHENILISSMSIYLYVYGLFIGNIRETSWLQEIWNWSARATLRGLEIKLPYFRCLFPAVLPWYFLELYTRATSQTQYWIEYIPTFVNIFRNMSHFIIIVPLNSRKRFCFALE